jgi:adenylate kinase family enzyme
VKRVAVITTASGCGGTTFGKALAERLGVPYVELDALFWRPGWVESTSEELRAAVEPIVATDAWVIDGGYWGRLGDVVVERSELVVWLDLRIATWLPRLLRRTMRRIVRREVLWNGNRETFRGAFLGRDALIPYMLRNYRRRRRVYPDRLSSYDHVRLRSQREVEDFLRSVEPVT